MESSSSTTVEGVEGEWNNFTISLADPDDFEPISVHLRNNFYRDEPINKLFDWSETKAGDYDLMMRAILSHGLSLKAVDTTTNEIAGVVITVDSRRQLDFYSLTIQSPLTHKILTIMNKLNREAQIETTFNVDSHAEFFMSSVEQKYRGQNLASELYNRSLTLLKSKGIPLVKSSFASPITRKIANKLGFEELTRLYLLDEDGEDGKPLFENASPDQFAAIMALRL